MLTTFTGRKIDIAKFTKDDIDLRDIAISLSRQRRYAGHTSIPWTVGQHIILCYMIADFCEHSEDMKKAAFLHDVEETWVQDIIYSVKSLYVLNRYNAVSSNISYVVFDFFGLPDDFMTSLDNKRLLKAIDETAHIYESMHLFPGFVHDSAEFTFTTNEIVKYLTQKNFAIPNDLFRMHENEVAQNILEILQVMHTEKMVGQEISSELTSEA